MASRSARFLMLISPLLWLTLAACSDGGGIGGGIGGGGGSGGGSGGSSGSGGGGSGGSGGAFGGVLETWSIDGPNTTSDELTGVRLDSQGYLLVSGVIGMPVSPPQYDAVVAKLDLTSNSILWYQPYNGAGNKSDGYYGVAVDGQDNVIAVGHETLADGTTNILVRKHSSDGAPLWVQSFDGPAKGDDHGWGIATNAAGDVFIAGTYAVTNQGPDILVMKLAGIDGSLIWQHLQNGAANDDDEAFGIATFGSFVYAVGQSTPVAGNADTWVRKLKDEGQTSTTVWTREIDGVAHGYDTALGVAAAPGGDFLIAGIETSANEGQDGWLGRYDADGNEAFTRTFNATSLQDNYWAVASDSKGNAVVTGFQTVSLMDRDIITHKYDATGALVWANDYNGSASGDDYGEGITTNAEGQIVVVGAALTSSQGYDGWVRKLAP